MHLESKHTPLLPLSLFLGRFGWFALVAATILTVALAIGIFGYHFIARLAWIDALLEASMILAGMGPVAQITTVSAKLFASAYAIFSGVVFLTSVGVLFSPVLHRILHHFHLDQIDSDQ